MKQLTTNALLLHVYTQLKHKPQDTTPILIATVSEKQAKQVYAGLCQALPDCHTAYFPAWDTLPYEFQTPSPRLSATRISTLFQCLTTDVTCVVASYHALMAYCPPKNFIAQNNLICSKNQPLPIVPFCHTLAELGYQKTETIMMPGEFAKRGSLVDVYPLGQSAPCRIDWLDDCIDSIRFFDPKKQQSYDEIEKITHLCAHEFSLNQKVIQRIKQRQSLTSLASQALIERIKDQQYDGLHFFLAALHETTDHFLEYFAQPPYIIHQSTQPIKLMKRLYQDNQLAYLNHPTTHHQLLRPEQVWDPATAAKLDALPNTHIQINDIAASHPTAPLYGFEQPLNNCLKRNGHMIITAPSQHACNQLTKQIEAKYQIKPTPIQHLSQLDAPGIYLMLATLEGTAQETSSNTWLLSVPTPPTTPLKQHIQPKTTHPEFDPLNLFTQIQSIQLGDYVAHERYGIAVFKGIQSMTINEQTSDFLCVEFADKDVVYVPVHALSLLSRFYPATGSGAPLLSKLGSKKWQNQKAKAIQHIDQLTCELLNAQTARSSTPGIRLTIDQVSYTDFTKQFPFELTPDQARTIDDVLSDLAKSTHMDRLVCGDVGFGKTEVAMRAIFVTIISGYQSVFLAPTTILAQQHHDRLLHRFKDWPIAMACVTRHTSETQKRTIKSHLASGKIDLLIGTHAALNPQYQFKALGLTVIDEEHRFGVKQKERLRQNCNMSNVLTLSATPIPRTLNLALSKLRSLSVIQTAPAHRLSIKTQICTLEDPVIHQAIRREQLRGGQIYFCINDIARLAPTLQQLQLAFPDLAMAIVHGQMPARQIEDVMRTFYMQTCQLLICTTLIESGIDIPNANTLIVERADLMGLTQLHQLRGRVGRSDIQAYAYLCTPKDATIRHAAQARLDALVQNQQVGAGFNIAMQDLETRGAGELLGAKQSGILQGIGMATYLKLLETCMQQRNNGQSMTRTLDIQTQLDCFIPEAYIATEATRLSIYCKIAASTHMEQMNGIQDALIDRFGPIPKPLAHLLQLACMRCCHKTKYIKAIQFTKTDYQLTLIQDQILLRKIFKKLAPYADQLCFKPPATICLKKQPQLTQNSGQWLRKIIDEIDSIQVNVHPEQTAEIFVT